MIEKTGLAEFFLINWDFVCFARENGVPGQGRGSAADSIVVHVLGITRVDPIEHNLLFERFLHEEMTTMPDIDIDFSTAHRKKVIRYTYEKYGRERTGMVCNLVTFKPRMAIQQGKPLGFPPDLLYRVAKGVDVWFDESNCQRSQAPDARVNSRKQGREEVTYAHPSPGTRSPGKALALRGDEMVRSRYAHPLLEPILHPRPREARPMNAAVLENDLHARYRHRTARSVSDCRHSGGRVVDLHRRAGPPVAARRDGDGRPRVDGYQAPVADAFTKRLGHGAKPGRHLLLSAWSRSSSTTLSGCIAASSLSSMGRGPPDRHAHSGCLASSADSF